MGSLREEQLFPDFRSESCPLSAQPPELIKETDGVTTLWIPPTEAQRQHAVANPHPRTGTVRTLAKLLVVPWSVLTDACDFSLWFLGLF